MSAADFLPHGGTWARREPRHMRALFDGYPGVWWIAGGWALEAFSGRPRPHEDIDLGILRSDLPLLRAHFRDTLDVWAPSSGGVKRLRSDDRIRADADDVLPEDGEQVWLRAGADADAPWECDILLGPGTPDEWHYKRDPSIRMPMASALWERDGIRYLQPEIQLLYKAKGLRANDDADFAAALPLLDERRRRWLADGLTQTIPGHPWLTRLT